MKLANMKLTKLSSMNLTSLVVVFLAMLLTSCSIFNSDSVTTVTDATATVTDATVVKSPNTSTSNGEGSDTAGVSGEAGDMAGMGSDGNDMAGMTASGDVASHSGHGGTQEVPADLPIPTIDIEVLKDPMTGWNLHVETTNYTLAPERVSTEHVDGEGHMHLYINGEKISRLYGYWHDLGELPPGEHEIRVVLSTNSHADLTLNGQKIEDTEIVSVPASDSGTSTSQPADSHADSTNADGMPATGHGTDNGHGTGTSDGHGVVDEPTEYDADVELAVRTIDLNITDGAVTVVDNDGEILRGPQRLNVELNSVVALRVTSDVEEQVHIHGYDILRQIGNDTPTHFAFKATLAGVYEVELEGSSSLLLQLTVS